jgi:hypothetical protein
MTYPDWVLKHKKKGTYVNCVKGRYYLYAAHSERIPGTKKVRRVCDGYLGRITEEDGFIPARDKVSTEILVYEYGFSAFVMWICKNELFQLSPITGKHADWLLVASILSVLHGTYDNQKLSGSYLSVLYPEVDLSRHLGEEVPGQIEELVIQIKRFLENLPEEERGTVYNELPYVYKVQLNHHWYESKQNDAVRNLFKIWHV